MYNPLYEHVRRDPRFNELVEKRNRLTRILFTLIITSFFIFIALVSFQPDFLARRISPDSQLTIGVIAELFLFIFFLALSVIYVQRANGEFDRITCEVATKAAKENMQ